ncbi:MAG: hypothetical protein EBU93_01745 [Chlamydiae bacterium]|nr:hypothetical protein [Chlamydiota bacterium]
MEFARTHNPLVHSSSLCGPTSYFRSELAQFISIDHDDAIIAHVYQVNTQDQKKFILKICPKSIYKKAFLEGYSSIRPVPNYERVMPLLKIGRALAVIGFTVRSSTWNNKNHTLYRLNRDFLDHFAF